MAGQDPDLKRSVLKEHKVIFLATNSYLTVGGPNADWQGLVKSMSRSKGSRHGGVRTKPHQARACLAQLSEPNINPCADDSYIE